MTADVERNTRADVFAELLEQGRRSDLVVVSLYVNWSSASAEEPLTPEPELPDTADAAPPAPAEMTSSPSPSGESRSSSR